MTKETLDPAAAPRVVQEFLERVRPSIDAELDRRLTAGDDDPGRLREAMRYAALGPGKRLRPALVLAACEAAGGAPEAGDAPAALAAAAAVEMLHAYTLVHDDLPAMDDDDERRGRPTVHVVFGEAIAILAGDGLLTEAFAALADVPRTGDAVRTLAGRAGARELLGGQAIDLTEPPATTIAGLERLHERKTGALFAASTELGGIAAGATPEACAALGRLGMALGVAFQHADDRDDHEFAALAGEAAARMRTLCDEAAAIARGFGARGRTLEAIAAWIGAKA